MANNERADEAVKVIAAKYRDPVAAEFAVNDFRDWQNANKQTVTLTADEWDVVRAALGYMVEHTDPASAVHMTTGRIYHAVKGQTTGYSSDEAIAILRSVLS